LRIEVRYPDEEEPKCPGSEGDADKAANANEHRLKDTAPRWWGHQRK
jgi:hypothetical protein